MALPVRFRGADRDRQTDIERLRPLHLQLSATVTEIERAIAGLSRRLEEARTRAATLMGNEDGIYFEREPADEARLVEAEAQMMAAYRRIEELRAQRALLMACHDGLAGFGHAGKLRGVAGPIGLLARLSLSIGARTALLRLGFRVLGWGLLIGIVYATLSGIEQRPSVPWLVPNIERSLAFLVTAASFAIGYPRQRPMIFAVGLGAVALLELAQGWTPTRHGAVQDALVKAAGLGLGLLLVLALERFRRYALLS